MNIHCVLLLLAATAATLVSGNYLAEKHSASVHSRFLPSIPQATESYAHEHHEKNNYMGAIQQPTDHLVQRHTVDNKVASIYKRQIHVISKTLESAKHRKLSFAETFQKVKKSLKSVLSEHPANEHEEIKRLLVERFSSTASTGATTTGDVSTNSLRRRRMNTNDPCMDAIRGTPDEQRSADDIGSQICVMNYPKTQEAEYQFDGNLKNQKIDPCMQCAGPGQICHGVPACTDYLTACTTLDETQQASAKAEFEQAKAAIISAGQSGTLYSEWWDQANDHPCNLVNTCPMVKGEDQRNEACELAVKEYCCDPDSSDCSLIERTPCSPNGCGSATKMYEDAGHLMWEAAQASGLSEEEMQKKWMEMEKDLELNYKCPFSEETLCVDPEGTRSYDENDGGSDNTNANWVRGGRDTNAYQVTFGNEGGISACANSNYQTTCVGNSNSDDSCEDDGYLQHRFYHDMKQVKSMTTRINKPCYGTGDCFLSSILDSCKIANKIEERPLGSIKYATNEMNDDMSADTLKITKDTCQKESEGNEEGTCATGCCSVIGFVMDKMEEVRQIVVWVISSKI